MPWNSQFPNIWIGLLVGFGVISLALFLGFYMLLRSMGELKEKLARMDSRFESVEKKVDEVVKQFEEI